MGRFIGQVELTPLVSNGGLNWNVDYPFLYMPASGSPVRVEAGFITDLASVPRFLWSAWPPEGLYTEAAVIHDFCYRNQLFERKRCDTILREAMTDLGVSFLDRFVIYWGVRLGGRTAYDSYRTAKAGR